MVSCHRTSHKFVRYRTLSGTVSILPQEVPSRLPPWKHPSPISIEPAWASETVHCDSLA
jgi:hypothetical protein